MDEAVRVLTTHVGSMPRPADLASLLKKRHSGEGVDALAFDVACRNASFSSVADQVASGIDIVSDGEMSKISYAYYVQDRLSGFAPAEIARGAGREARRFQRLAISFSHFPDYAAFRTRNPTGPAGIKAPVCTGALSYTGMESVKKDLDVLKDAAARAGARNCFMTAASPGVVAMFASETTHYKSEDDYVFALAEALRQEYEAIHAAGVILQIDCPDLPLAPRMAYTGKSEDPFRIVARNIEAVNHAIANIPGDRVRLHICWGNHAGPHTDDMDAAKLFPYLRKTRARYLSFEAANPRHAHEWEDWKNADLPDDMVLIPGVIDSTTNFVEHPRLVAQRIARFTDAVGRDRVIAGCDCGFGTFATDTPQVFPTVVLAKLRALSEGARLV
jgi:5-methyltetrahydropteroyltriglutamate--homocysteine methyltransferase